MTPQITQQKLLTTPLPNSQTSNRFQQLANIYPDNISLLTAPPNNIPLQIMRNLPSAIDRDTLEPMNWNDIAQNFTTCVSQAHIYGGELVHRMNYILNHRQQNMNDTQNSLNQLQESLDKAQQLHSDEIKRIQDETREKLKNKDNQLQELKENYWAEIAKLRAKKHSMEAQIESLVKTAKATEIETEQRITSLKQDFIASDEFVQICGHKARAYFEAGFQHTVDLFKEQGYPPEGAPSDFIDLLAVAKRLPPDE